MARRTWFSLFKSLFGTVSENSTKMPQRANLALERMEDRTTPAVTALDGLAHATEPSATLLQTVEAAGPSAGQALSVSG
jgi:hypothetical protein